MLDVNITATNYVVTATETAYNFTVSSDNSLFTVTDVSYLFTVTNNITQVSFDGGTPGFDPSVKFRGDWVSGTVYTRNDLVNYAYSLYVCQIEYNTTLTSTTPPPSDSSNWIRIVWKEAPFAWVTSTGFVDVGTNLSVGASARIAGNLGVTGTTNIVGPLTVDSNLSVTGTTTLVGPLTVSNNTGTFRDLNVTRQFNINGLNYPVQKGSFGQVLTTNGSTTATWTNLGDLQSWSLNADLYTNEFNIVTGIDDTAAPAEIIYRDLTIGTGETGNFQAYLNFNGGRSGSGIPTINAITTLYSSGALSLQSDSGAVTMSGVGDLTISGNEVNISASTANPTKGINLSGPRIRVSGIFTATGASYFTEPIHGETNLDPVRIGDGGIIFADGTVQLSAGGGAFTATQIASSSTLGVIRVGQYLSINSGTGVLSVDRDTLKSGTTWYTLPRASTSTLGGIAVGNGLVMDGDTLNVATTITSVVGRINLTEDMYTNVYAIRRSSGSSTYIDLSNARFASGNNSLDLFANTVYLTADTTSIELSKNNSTIYIKANETVIGQSAGYSTLQVGRIYNYAGTNAPFFPAGVQYPDNTIQVTAFYPDQGLLI